MAEKRCVAIADLHCGHVAGLTPPAWQYSVIGDGSRRDELARVEAECWDKYCELVRAMGKIDVLMVVGDMIDGKGQLTGATELITADLGEQAAMAETAISMWDASRILLFYGTAYHASPFGDDWEKMIARKLGTEIHSHIFPKIEDVIFDVRHHISASSIPHGRGTPIARARLWNILWAERGEQPKAQVILRAHVHSFNFVGGAGWIGFTLPALQAARTKYGARICEGTVDWGALELQVDGENVVWSAHLIKLMANVSEPLAVL